MDMPPTDNWDSNAQSQGGIGGIGGQNDTFGSQQQGGFGQGGMQGGDLSGRGGFQGQQGGDLSGRGGYQSQQSGYQGNTTDSNTYGTGGDFGSTGTGQQQQDFGSGTGGFNGNDDDNFGSGQGQGQGRQQGGKVSMGDKLKGMSMSL